MMMSRVGLLPFLLPIGLGACSAPADASPFGEAAAATDTASAPPAATQNPTPAPSSVVPSLRGAPAPAGDESGATDALPIAPAPEEPNGADPPAEAPNEPPTPAQPEPQTPPLDANECASYETGFLPLVHEPVCSRCHTSGRGLPQFEPFAQAERRCAQIGQLVSAGEMPPGGGLSTEQRAVVESWVSLDCPETAEQAAAVCAPPVTPAPDPTPPAGSSGGGDDDDDDDGDDEDDGDDREDDDEDG